MEGEVFNWADDTLMGVVLSDTVWMRYSIRWKHWQYSHRLFGGVINK